MQISSAKIEFFFNETSDNEIPLVKNSNSFFLLKYCYLDANSIV